MKVRDSWFFLCTFWKDEQSFDLAMNCFKIHICWLSEFYMFYKFIWLYAFLQHTNIQIRPRNQIRATFVLLSCFEILFAPHSDSLISSATLQLPAVSSSRKRHRTWQKSVNEFWPWRKLWKLLDWLLWLITLACKIFSILWWEMRETNYLLTCRYWRNCSSSFCISFSKCLKLNWELSKVLYHKSGQRTFLEWSKKLLGRKIVSAKFIYNLATLINL